MGADSKLKYKVIKEYERYYLTQNERGHKECFDKIFHKPDKNGYITKKLDLRSEEYLREKEREDEECT